MVLSHNRSIWSYTYHYINFNAESRISSCFTQRNNNVLITQNIKNIFLQTHDSLSGKFRARTRAHSQKIAQNSAQLSALRATSM